VRQNRDMDARNGTVTALSRDVLRGMLQVMMSITPTAPDSCPLCRGKGWKLVILRGSPANMLVAADSSRAHRRRTMCLARLGTGQATAE
jgi:hypothetical protein